MASDRTLDAGRSAPTGRYSAGCRGEGTLDDAFVPDLLIEMPSGVAGDMLLAALTDLGGDLDHVQRDLLALGIGPVRIAARRVQRSGISALQVDVEAEQEPRWRQPAASAVLTPQAAHHAPHRPYRIIRDLLAAAALPERVKARAQRVFRALAEAEAKVHGVDPETVEFHEVGALDAIADVVGCCLLLEQLGIARVIAGPLLPGEGWVRCAHGRMPVPVPAVAELLAAFRAPQRRVGRETGELTTPTGCALVCALADRWLAGDDLRIARIGYGAGHKEFADLPNVLRVALVETGAAGDAVVELRCQIDDATGEALAHALEALLAAGARDAYLAPITMKKGRPAHELTVLCREHERERLARLVCMLTPTIGVRWSRQERLVLPRRMESVSVDGHAIALKVATLPDGGERAKPEADAVAAAATALGLPFAEVARRALAMWQERAR